MVIVSFSLSRLALADGPPDPSPQVPCIGCHHDEGAAWAASPHAQASDQGQSAVTCEGCHGTYTENHPESGLMALKVDSSICQACHTTTALDWQSSRHAQVGVQCIGCHQSHAQQFRLTDEALCQACHQDQIGDVFHTAHTTADLTCTNCHGASTTAETFTQISTGGSKANTSSGHDFTRVQAEQCVTCHKQAIGDGATFNNADWLTQAGLLAEANQVPTLTDELATARREQKSLQAMIPVSLGLGLGVGGILGISSVLVLGYLSRRRSK